MNFLNSLINPKIALNLVKSQIEKTIGAPVKNYTIFYRKDFSNIQILVNNTVYEIPDSGNITKLIGAGIKSKVKKNQIVDVIKIQVSGEIYKGVIYFKENDIKKFLNFDL